MADMNLRNAMRRIDDKLPVDTSVLDDTIESGLCRGDIIQVSNDMFPL